MRSLLWAFKQLRGRRIRNLVLIALLLTETVFGLLSVYLQRYIVDDVFVAGRYEQLAGWLIALSVAVAGASALTVITPSLLNGNQIAIRRGWLGCMLQNYHSKPYSTISQEQTGNYFHLFSEDLNQSSTLLGIDIPLLIQQLFSVGLLIYIIGTSNIAILGTILVATLIYVWIGKRFAPKLRGIGREIQESKRMMTVHLEDGISGTREVVAYNRIAWERNRYIRLFQNYFYHIIREGKLKNKQLAWSDFVRTAIILAVLGFGGYELFRDRMSVGEFIVVYQFTYQLMESMRNLFQSVISVASKTIFLDNIRGHLNPVVEESDNAVPEIHDQLSFRQVSFSYPDRAEPVLHQLTMDIPIGRKTAIVGESGSGKSTLAQLLVSLYEPSSGQIIIDGRLLGDFQRKSWLTRLAVVYQEPYFFSESIRDNLKLGKTSTTDEMMIEACRRARIHDDIVRLPESYDTMLGERGITLSGGQRQRLAIARALLVDPDILLLDEATSALDLETERHLLQELDQIRAGRTTILIAHRMSTVKEADLICVLDQGMLAEAGTHNELLSREGLYAKLYHASQMPELRMQIKMG